MRERQTDRESERRAGGQGRGRNGRAAVQLRQGRPAKATKVVGRCWVGQGLGSGVGGMKEERGNRKATGN